MGCDIHSFVEVKVDGAWKFFREPIFVDKYCPKEPFANRSYRVFGFLADVRNYSHVPCITFETRGLPNDLSAEGFDYMLDSDYHSPSWLLVSELLKWDYAQTFEDRRTTKLTSGGWYDGAADAGSGNGYKTTYRDFLGSDFFADLSTLGAIGNPENVRVVFAFDN